MFSLAEVFHARYAARVLLSAIGFTSFNVVAAFAVPSQAVTLPLRSYPGNLLIIPVTVNGSGPYDFVVDTGSNTTIIEAGLFRELGLQEEGAMHLSGMVKQNTEALTWATARMVAVSGLAVQNLEVLATKSLNVGTLNHHVRGILGENFLDQFDLLIDNEHKQITLDPGDGLASSFEGERLPLSLFSTFQGKEVLHRPMVPVIVPSFDSHPLRLLLDTGGDALTILPHQGMMWRAANGGFSGATQISTMYGVMSCAQWQDKARLGKSFASTVTVVSCPGATAENADNEGAMPTHVFKQLLISHRSSYVIANPLKRSPPSQETAAESTSLQ